MGEGSVGRGEHVGPGDVRPYAESSTGRVVVDHPLDAEAIRSGYSSLQLIVPKLTLSITNRYLPSLSSIRAYAGVMLRWAGHSPADLATRSGGS